MPLLCVDLDNTLVDRNGAFRSWLVSYCEEHELSVDDAAWITQLDNNSDASREFVFDSIVARTGGDADATYEAYRAHVATHIALLPGALDGLASARAAGWTLWAVSNGEGPVQRAKVAATGLADHIDGIAISGEVDVRKPDPGIFVRAAADAGCSLEGAWMIGDSAPADIGGAAAAGIASVWISMHRRWIESRYQPTAAATRLDDAVKIVLDSTDGPRGEV